MTAETLKPFITPASVDNFPATHSSSTSRRRQRSGQIVAIGLGVTGVLLATVLLGFMVWHTICISHLKAEVKHLNHIVESMQNRLGLTYLDDLKDFQKEYSNAVFDNPTDDFKEGDDDEDDEDDEDEDEDDSFYTREYDESYEDESLGKDVEDDEEDVKAMAVAVDEDVEYDSSDDDNVYGDFEKYNDSKKKKSSRKMRSIQQTPHGLPVYEASYLAQLNKTAGTEEQQGQQPQQHQRTHRPTMRPQSIGYNTLNAKGSQKRHIVAEGFDSRRTPLRPRGHHRRRKVPLMKSGDSLLSAKSAGLMNSMSSAPAAHFHLNRKVRDRYAVDAYPGDIYIGHRSRANELATEHFFRVDAGVLTVREPGLYYIYAQVCYNNTHDQNGFVIFHGHKAFLQCLNTVPTNMPKLHTCHTSGLIHLGANETIHLRDFHSDRNVILKDDNNRSYFGIIKI